MSGFELLEKEIPRLIRKIRNVQLCFTMDSFMYEYEDICAMSLRAIKLLNENDIPCTVLSKGEPPVQLADLSSDNMYGITFVSLDENYREEYEPGAAPYRSPRRGAEGAARARMQDLGEHGTVPYVQRSQAGAPPNPRARFVRRSNHLWTDKL